MTSNDTSPLRHAIARAACQEVQVLACMLHAYIEEHDRDGETAPAMRGSLLRLSQLSDILFEAAVTATPAKSDDQLVETFGGRRALGLVKEGGAT